MVCVLCVCVCMKAGPTVQEIGPSILKNVIVKSIGGVGQRKQSNREFSKSAKYDDMAI